MKKSYRGACERAADHAMANGKSEIYINWINVSQKEAVSGGADRITKKLIDAGYRPNGSCVNEKLREAYETGQKMNGQYVRLPQETWTKEE